MKWFCRNCCWNGQIELFTSISDQPSYVCIRCGVNGKMYDDDAPILISEETADKYWYELQNDPTFIPPENYND